MCATVLISREVAGFISIIHLMQTLLFGISVFDFFLLLKIFFIRCGCFIFQQSGLDVCVYTFVLHIYFSGILMTMKSYLKSSCVVSEYC